MLKRLRSLLDAVLVLLITSGTYCGAVLLLVNPGLAVDDSYVGSLQFGIFYAILCFLYMFYVYRELYRKKIYLNLRFRERFLMCLFSIAVTFIVIVIQETIQEGAYQMIPTSFRVLIVVCITFLYLGFPMFMIKNKLSKHFEMGEKYQQEIVSLELQHFEQYKEAQEETRRFRHDMVNNLMAIQMLQTKGSNDEAKAYVDELLGHMQALSPKVVTGSDLLDCILTAKIERMEQLGITHTIEGVMDYGLNISPVDTCAIFANALDNAIEACEKVTGERHFTMKIRKSQAFYCVVMENTMVADAITESKLKSGRFTTKKNAELHGYGLSNIEKTVHRCGGDITVEAAGGIFTLTVMLPWKEA